MRRAGLWGLPCLVACACLLDCRAPTEVKVQLTTDFGCAAFKDVGIIATDPDKLASSAPGAISSACSDGDLGSIVFVPSGANDASIAIEIASPSECTSTFAADCIVARRLLRYLPHTPLVLPIVLSAACKGVSCPADQTCAGGVCTSAEATCANPGACSLGGADAGSDAPVGPPPTDAAPDAPATLSGFHDMTNGAFWSGFDATSLPTWKSGTGFAGGVFDGQYVYLVPSSSGVVVRYDTRTAFGSVSSWSAFDAASVDATAQHFFGGAFDGRYVYFAPQAHVVARFDTRAPFAAASSWSTFDVGTVAPNGIEYAFRGAVFDGRYVYLVPTPGPNAIQTTPLAARYDTRAAFGASTSWETFPLTSTPHAANNCLAFAGGAVDGRYVYFSPGTCRSSNLPELLQYDTQAPFTSASSWTRSSLSSDQGFVGAVFDGQYVHYPPVVNGSRAFSMRYDTTLPFTSAFAFDTFDIATLGANVGNRFGGAFDGRYVYMIPGTAPVIGSSVIVRYDTTASYSATASWSTFDTTPLLLHGGGFFAGAVFDGEYLYLVPSSGSTMVLRFDARSPASLPAFPAYTGSFL